MYKMKTLIRIWFVILLTTASYAQPPQTFESKLEELSQTQSGLNNKIQLSVSGISLSDFISAIALENNLNVSVDDDLDKIIVNNFYDAMVKDVFVFLVKKHELHVEIVGSIISFSKKPPIKEEPAVYVPKEINVTYKTENEFLSLDLKRDSLYRVAEAITRASDKNVVLAPNIKDRLVSVYIENRPFDQTVEMMSRSNGLKVTSDENGFYYIELDEQPVKNPGNGGTRPGNKRLNPELDIVRNSNDQDRLDVEAKDTPIQDIIEQASSELGEKYFMYDIPEGNTTLKVEGVTFEELLEHILSTTDYTFKKDEKYYLIGNRTGEGLRATELIQMENRTIENVMNHIPAELLAGLDVKEFVDLNGLIVSGSYIAISELKEFLRSIDQVVPLVQVEIMIVESIRTSNLNTGIEAGLSNEPVVTNGTIFPGVDMTLGSETINGLINAFNGFGIINLGAVTPNFYVTLQAMEDNSMIDISSTPNISTLNGHEATFSVGQTDYYQEEQVNFQPNISGGSIASNRVWKSTDANLSVTVTPNVSADEYVTLDINVEQNDFIAGAGDGAPPGKSTRSFSSLVRVKNGETILMGGLEIDNKSDSGSGTPFLSRVPILKYLFSSRNRSKDKRKLHIFIKTTVTY
jgi:type IV pilus assembly protein PilQ